MEQFLLWAATISLLTIFLFFELPVFDLFDEPSGGSQ